MGSDRSSLDGDAESSEGGSQRSPPQSTRHPRVRIQDPHRDDCETGSETVSPVTVDSGVAMDVESRGGTTDGNGGAEGRMRRLGESLGFGRG